jgi:hypothetical protein
MDYRGLNEVTRKDTYPLPRVDNTLDELKDANFNTQLDLASCLALARSSAWWRCPQDRLLHALWTIGIGRNALWPLQCTGKTPADDERHLARLFPQVCAGLPRRGLCLQSHTRRILGALVSCATTIHRGGLEVASQEMRIRSLRDGVLGLHCVCL